LASLPVLEQLIIVRRFLQILWQFIEMTLWNSERISPGDLELAIKYAIDT